jgi:hypothetical protein
MVYCGVNQIHRADEVTAVIKPLDKVAQTFGGVGCQMVDVVELVAVELLVDQVMIENRPFDELRPRGHVVEESAAEVVQHDDAVAAPQEVIGDVRPDEARAACDE